MKISDKTYLQTAGIPKFDGRDRFQLPPIELSPESSMSCIYSPYYGKVAGDPPLSLVANFPGDLRIDVQMVGEVYAD